jgi:hypothetical protein
MFSTQLSLSDLNFKVELNVDKSTVVIGSVCNKTLDLCKLREHILSITEEEIYRMQNITF